MGSGLWYPPWPGLSSMTEGRDAQGQGGSLQAGNQRQVAGQPIHGIEDWLALVLDTITGRLPT